MKEIRPLIFHPPPAPHSRPRLTRGQRAGRKSATRAEILLEREQLRNLLSARALGVGVGDSGWGCGDNYKDNALMIVPTCGASEQFSVLH